MNYRNLNPQPMMIPFAGNPNFAYFGPFPITPIQYQFPSFQNWPTFQRQWSIQHPFFQNASLQQHVVITNSPSVNSVTNENNSVCTGFDDENERAFEKRYLKGDFIKPKFEEDGEDDDSVKEVFVKSENMNFNGDFPVMDGIKPKLEAKLEYKVERSDSSENTIRRSWQVKKELFEDDDDEDEDETNLLKEENQKSPLKVQLKEMINFIIEHFGRIRDADLIKEKMKYQHSAILSQIFEILHSKYSCTFKTRAEIVKYITRKAFATIKNNSKKESDASSREACKALCKRYFQVSSEEILSSGVDIENRERFLQLLFPYQKNSKNKLQDMELISKLMSSKEFFEDYCLYVQDLETILEVDNDRKLNKFLNFIISCVSKNQIDNIMKYKRVPWLKAWLDNTKIVAKELAYSIQWKGQQTKKKCKKDKAPL